MDPLGTPVVQSAFVPPGQVYLINGMAFTQQVDQVAAAFSLSMAAVADAMASILTAFGEGLEWKGEPVDGCALVRG